jgi:hypothetical protein
MQSSASDSGVQTQVFAWQLSVALQVPHDGVVLPQALEMVPHCAPLHETGSHSHRLLLHDSSAPHPPQLIVRTLLQLSVTVMPPQAEGPLVPWKASQRSWSDSGTQHKLVVVSHTSFGSHEQETASPHALVMLPHLRSAPSVHAGDGIVFWQTHVLRSEPHPCALSQQSAPPPASQSDGSPHVTVIMMSGQFTLGAVCAPQSTAFFPSGPASRAQKALSDST